jgi:hypothetical protein
LLVLVPVGVVATLLTSGTTSVKPAEHIRTTIATLVRADNRDHADAIDVTLDRRIKLLTSIAG